jgi:hypothetical protein
MGCYWMTSVISSQPKHKSFVKNSWLWTGESTYCICTHHVGQHCTIRDQSDHVIAIHCHGTDGNSKHCSCGLFRAHCIRIDSCYCNSNERKNMGESKFEL